MKNLFTLLFLIFLLTLVSCGGGGGGGGTSSDSISDTTNNTELTYDEIFMATLRSQSNGNTSLFTNWARMKYYEDDAPWLLRLENLAFSVPTNFDLIVYEGTSLSSDFTCKLTIEINGTDYEGTIYSVKREHNYSIGTTERAICDLYDDTLLTYTNEEGILTITEPISGDKAYYLTI